MSNAETFWKGSQGNDYVERNRADDLLPTYTAMWSRILARTTGITSALEIGANVGTNLRAIHHLMPRVKVAAIEPNLEARGHLNERGIQSYGYLAEDKWQGLPTFDLVFTRGVLIHVPPEKLIKVYANLVEHSSKYVMVAEYFSPRREMIRYRGEDNRLWRADFAGELMDSYNLKLVDYFFVYNRDPNAPQDNITTFLLEKT